MCFLFRNFAIVFLGSFIGLTDAYMDATAIGIAYSCASQLWKWAFVIYGIGVVGVQWVLIGCLALWGDSSGACLLKVLHMDAAASSLDLATESEMTLWAAVNVARFLAEDVPQTVIQILFVIHVKKNYYMMLSSVVGVVSSAKAIYDACARQMQTGSTDNYDGPGKKNLFRK